MIDDNKIVLLLNELCDHQAQVLLECGRQFVSHLTAEDILQPNDFPMLEHNPHFRYEEGFLAGMLSAKAALLGLIASKKN